MTVHVMAPPDNRPLQYDEAVCTEACSFHEVVFHPWAEPYGDGFLCPECNECSATDWSVS
jgi:hypothetical protein